MCLYIDVKEHDLRDLGEPAKNKPALLDPKSDKWLNAMNVEMQSMKDNKISELVDLPPDEKTVDISGSSKRRPTWMERQNRDEPCVYVKASGSYVTFLILYVDDILIIGKNIPMLQDVKSYLGRSFAMKDLGEVAYILGNLDDAHWTAVKNIMKYFCNTKDMFLVYEDDTKQELMVSCYTDVGYLTDADDMKS
nr:retrovirus-related Pol polyprotein from transposon TNT 1-94 [Tanacetum cinerariifolium]